MPKAVAIYVRISKDRAGVGLGVKRQEDEARALCKARRWPVAVVFSDNDISAYSGKPRAGYAALVAAIAAGEVDAVVAWHPDRLHRSPRELEDFIELVDKAGAQIATVMAGEYDLSTAAGRMTARVVGAVARHESEQKRERIKSMHHQLAHSGRWKGGGTRPFGYDTSPLRIREAEAALVRDAANRILHGESVRAVCADWNATAVPNATGGTWSSSVLRRILTAPFAAGLREHAGVVVAKGDWPPIIDEVTHNRLRRLLLDPARRKNRMARRYLLTGLLICSKCNAKMVSRPRDDKRRAYTCAKGPGYHGCGHMGSLAEPLEEEVAGRLLVALADGTLDELRRAQAEEPGESLLEHTAIEIRSTLDQVARDHYENLIDRGQFLAATADLRARLDATQHALSAFEHSRVAMKLLPSGGDLDADWRPLSFDQQRAIVLDHVEAVTLSSAVKGRNFFDPDRVAVSWR